MILPSEYLGPKTGASAGDLHASGVKRAIDVVLSTVGLLALLPVFSIVAVAINLDSAGPILYAQERVGLNRRKARARNGNGNGTAPASERREGDCCGRPFKIYKFRSMVVDAEKNTGAVWASKNDSRITRLGTFLRKSRIDETPQLWNVLKGDMSLVGPRPERPKFVVELSRSLPDYPQRCEALPGITGLAQVKWQYDTSVETVNRKLQYDLYYVRNRRLLLDLKIMAATVKVMARGEGAH
jgi:lipopolysaccharide/colanic/teichoic acid biosynthesis glycosyltransferase